MLYEVITDIEPAFESQLIAGLFAPADEDLPDRRLHRPGGFPQHGVLGGDGAPAQKTQAMLGDDLLRQTLAAVTQIAIWRQKEHPHPVFARRRQRPELVGEFLDSYNFV